MQAPCFSFFLCCLHKFKTLFNIVPLDLEIRAKLLASEHLQPLSVSQDGEEEYCYLVLWPHIQHELG